MYQNKKISLVLPCHNEELGLKKILPQIPGFIGEIIVVDNNSIDGTAKVAKEFGAKVIFEPNLGYGRAYKAGFSKASGGIVITMDGDGQYPLDAIKRLANELERKNLDFISACRFPLANKDSMNLMRKAGNRFLTFVLNFLFGTNIKDSQSGMWVFKRSILPKLKLVSNGMSFSEEIKLQAMLNKDIKFAEYHINYYKRSGTSKLLPLRDGFLNLLFLLKSWWKYRKL